jgi:hypothetical protein
LPETTFGMGTKDFWYRHKPLLVWAQRIFGMGTKDFWGCIKHFKSISAYFGMEGDLFLWAVLGGFVWGKGFCFWGLGVFWDVKNTEG